MIRSGLISLHKIRNVIQYNQIHVTRHSSSLTPRGNQMNQFDFLLKRNLLEGIYPESPEYRDKLKNILKKPCSIYAGFDATSDSLHVGNLVSIMNLLHLRSFGHRVICVIGDATTRIGDPSGHSKDRIRMESSDIEKNTDSFEELIRTIFRNHEEYFCRKSDRNQLKDPVIIRNSTWYNKMNIIDFIEEAFRPFRVGSLLHKKSISERLKSQVGMNMSEFSYQIFQAYDWLMLRHRYDCKLQIGGSDQAGNIYSGHDFIKKCIGKDDSIGLLTPLITNSSGKKLGKSSSNSGPSSNIWLKGSKTSPYQLYQFFHQTPDSDVEKFLRIFSFHDNATIENLIYSNLKSENAWHCQKKLAADVCKLIHGEDGLESAKKITHAFFNRNPSDIAQLNDEELNQLFDDDSVIRMVHQDGLQILDLVKRAECFKNELEAERVISAGGLRINGSVVTSFNQLVDTSMIIGNGVTVMRLGKKSYHLFRWIK